MQAGQSVHFRVFTPEGRQTAGYDPFAKPTANARLLRAADGLSATQVATYDAAVGLISRC
jgi:hypothetical protein